MCAVVKHVAPLLLTAIISGRSHDMVCGSCFLYLLIFDFVKLTECTKDRRHGLMEWTSWGLLGTLSSAGTMPKEVNLFQYTIAEVCINV
uniref:Uncharacterized protein n=1 Tax=Triticum urartu TaxID=4572 RepID=A0A8R7K118_TRIUA